MKRKSQLISIAAALLFPVMVFAGPVNVNTATAETISAELQGVGLSKAQAIVTYRKENGPFRSADDLSQVKGIGSRTVDINRENIRIEDTPKKPK